MACAPNVSVAPNHGSDRPGTGEEQFSSCRIPSDYARLRILVKAFSCDPTIVSQLFQPASHRRYLIFVRISSHW